MDHDLKVPCKAIWFNILELLEICRIDNDCKFF